MLAQIEWGTITLISLAIFAALATLIGAVWKIASILFRIEGKVDIVTAHVADHCDELDEVKWDVKEISRAAGVEVQHQVAERRRVQARDAASP